jgi:hypothetical protein
MRVTFWSAADSAALIIEHADKKICHVTRHAGGDAAADAALCAAASGADLLVFPGPWEQGLALKARANAKLLALADGGTEGADAALAEAAARRCANVFFARHKMSLDL